MKNRVLARGLCSVLAFVFMLILRLLLPSLAAAQIPPAHKTQNVIVVMMDGLRWQEVFRGADPTLLPTLGPKWLGDPQKMARGMTSLVNQGVDAIINGANTPSVVQQGLKMAKEKGIPVINIGGRQARAKGGIGK